jgi:hypothetical protein
MARLNALLKGENEEDGYRPVAYGEVLRRTAGKAMLKAIHTTAESKFLQINQFAFSKDGSLTIFDLVIFTENSRYLTSNACKNSNFLKKYFDACFKAQIVAFDQTRHLRLFSGSIREN